MTFALVLVALLLGGLFAARNTPILAVVLGEITLASNDRSTQWMVLLLLVYLLGIFLFIRWRPVGAALWQFASDYCWLIVLILFGSINYAL